MDGSTVVATVVVAVIYLALLRLIDMNEKEPLWALGMLLCCGAAASIGLGLAVPGGELELDPLRGALAEELARAVAIFAGMLALTAIGARRGVSEINGVMDGVVYGGAGGLGVALGKLFVPDAVAIGGELGDIASAVDGQLVGWTKVALSGLSDCVFGALIGAGLAAMLMRGRDPLRALYPALGWLAAAGGHWAYSWASRDHALGGASADLWQWSTLLGPLAVIVVVALRELRRERAALDGLKDEAGVTERDIELLRKPLRRQLLYLRRGFSADRGAGLLIKRLHNRQVQLALALRRGADDDAAWLRSAIKTIRDDLCARAAHAAEDESAS